MSADILFNYFPNLSAKQKQQFQRIAPVYQTWNSQLNLISRKDIEHLYLKHVLHSLGIAKVVAPQPGTRILDVGTGGGFPGIPLAIMFPEAQFHLVDSVGKKIRAAQNIAEELGLQNVSTTQIRVEQMTDERYDFILGRAVTHLAQFYDWTKDKVADHNQHTIDNGILYLKGNDNLHMAVAHKTYPLQDFFTEPFFATKQIVHLMPQAAPSS